MNWNLGNLSLVDDMMYVDERYLGTFSSYEAGMEAIRWQRGIIDVTHHMTSDDIDLMEAIDADEP